VRFVGSVDIFYFSSFFSCLSFPPPSFFFNKRFTKVTSVHTLCEVGCARHLHFLMWAFLVCTLLILCLLGFPVCIYCVCRAWVCCYSCMRVYAGFSIRIRVWVPACTSRFFQSLSSWLTSSPALAHWPFNCGAMLLGENVAQHDRLYDLAAGMRCDWPHVPGRLPSTLCVDCRGAVHHVGRCGTSSGSSTSNTIAANAS